MTNLLLALVCLGAACAAPAYSRWGTFALFGAGIYGWLWIVGVLG